MTAAGNTVTSRELRKFGLIMAAMITLFFGLLIPWIWGTGVSVWVFVVASAFALVALSVPALLGPVHYVWMKIGLVLGWINTRIILGLLFFLIFVPLGLLLRLSRDPMRRKIDRSLPTYIERSAQPAPSHLERPY
ncbi:MAG: SxtJ family membrane protein [Gammaproteobacteria bacterium]|jgi:hypothetical protein|nr:sxtJ [Gammaproteobacteria bacterium]